MPMQSQLFDQSNLEKSGQQRFSLQNPQMLRVAFGEDVLAVKGAMVAYQGQIQFHHEGAGSVGKLLRKMVASEDVPLMRVSGQGEVFFASEAGFVYLVDLGGDRIAVNGHSLLAFDATLQWDIKRVQGAGFMSGSLFTTVVSGQGTVALHAIGHPVVLDCSQQPTYVDITSIVAWSSHLVPQVVSSMNMRSVLRGGSGEAFQYVFHGPGFVVVQPSDWRPTQQVQGSSSSSGNNIIGGLFN